MIIIIWKRKSKGLTLLELIISIALLAIIIILKKMEIHQF
ncbi:prepilin-type N-terminal cleavage/methylation domain-containing protein [Clostridium sp. DL1XJH146]